MRKLGARLFNSVKQVLQLTDNPKSIAKGFALGSFIGMMPIPGLQMIVSLSIASVLKINRKAACIAVFNTNVLTGAFVFAFNYWLGKKLLGINSDFLLPENIDLNFIKSIFHAGTDVYMSLIAGGVITGIPAALIAYFIVKKYLAKRNIVNN